MNLEGLQVVGETPMCSVAAAGGVCVARVWGQFRSEESEIIREALEGATQDAPGVAFLLIIGPHSPPPAGPVRNQLGDMFGAFRENFTQFGAVVEGEGLAASVKRTITRVIMVFARVRCRHGLFHSVEEAVDWFTPESPSTAAAHMLEGFCSEHLYPETSLQGT